jgi:hypothetical protein
VAILESGHMRVTRDGQGVSLVREGGLIKFDTKPHAAYEVTIT